MEINCPQCRKSIFVSGPCCPKCGGHLGIKRSQSLTIDGAKSKSSARGFGKFFIIVAVACGIIAYQQTQETELERMNKNQLSLSKSTLASSKAVTEFLEIDDRLNGRKSSPRSNQSDDHFSDAISHESAEADRYESGRNQKLLFYSGVAAVFFIAGIICITR